MWNTRLVILAWLVFALQLPALSDPAFGGKPAEGRWRLFRTHRNDPGLTEEQRDMIVRLEALGYVDGSERPPAQTGVFVRRRDAVNPGANLYVSGHGPEAILIDMDGNELHRWRHEFRRLWPDLPLREKKFLSTFWRRAHLYENGDLLVIFEGHGIVKLDKNSQVIWANPLRVHHDFSVNEDGTIHVLTREAHMVPRLNTEEPILEDFISTLDAEGVEQGRISILESVENSQIPDLWPASLSRTGDVFHTNSLEKLDGRISSVVPQFRRGSFLVSLRFLNTVAVVDPGKQQVVWAYKGEMEQQHDPEILDNGNMLIFDNRGFKGRSTVLEIDPASRKTVWSYRGTPDRPFYSATCGTAQRLANGNTLITESDAGHVFEVTSEGEVVWEFYNPHRAGENGEYIATVLEMLRIPEDFPMDWREPAANR